MIEVMSEMKGIGARFQSGDLSTGLRDLDSLWDRIPEPKTETANSYMVIEYAVAFTLRLKDLDQAKKWASRAALFTGKRQDKGEVEFLVGKVAFECGETEAAKQSFVVANKKSRGRIFQGEDPKYRTLIGK
jgi:hypothetical protein